MLENYLFGNVKLTTNADSDKYKYAGYGAGLDAGRSFSLYDGSGFGKNVIVFSVDMSSCAHIDNRKNIF